MAILIHASVPTLGSNGQVMDAARALAIAAGCLSPRVAVFRNGPSENFIVEVTCADAPKEDIDGH